MSWKSHQAFYHAGKKLYSNAPSRDIFGNIHSCQTFLTQFQANFLTPQSKGRDTTPHCSIKIILHIPGVTLVGEIVWKIRDHGHINYDMCFGLT